MRAKLMALQSVLLVILWVALSAFASCLGFVLGWFLWPPLCRARAWLRGEELSDAD